MSRPTAAFVLVVLLAVGVVAGMGYYVLQIRDLARKNGTAFAALCAQRADLDRRIANTQKLIDETKGQKLVFAIPRKLIVDGQRQSRLTRQNLSTLDC